jgi:fibronectin type 3 domain-containing protein
VSLSWTASVSPGITGYNVYQGTVSGGPYAKLTSAPIPASQYTDTTVQSGNTYFYVVTSVNSSGEESPFSNQTAATIP